MNKIIIFSEESDHTTSNIIRWLYYYKCKIIIRININDLKFKVININNESVIIRNSFGNHEISKNDLVWFRRSPSIKVHIVNNKKNKDEFDFKLDIFNNLEKQSITDSLYYWILNNCKVIANPFESSSSKINTLIIAEELKINVPKWIICDSKKELKQFAKKNGKIVQKTFNHFNYYNKTTKETYYLYTQLIEDIDDYEIDFDSSFFQEYINKKYEIRSFFWNNQFYSMGIFSQNDNQTKIDFRNYNRKKPNRTAPMFLPQEYSDKLKKLMNRLDLDTGSIDILVTEDNEYVFLEVNQL